MHIYSVYGEAKDSNNLQKIVIIKEGFSWPAFCFSIFWIVYSAHWLVSCGVLFSVILTVIYLKVDVIDSRNVGKIENKQCLSVLLIDFLTSS